MKKPIVPFFISHRGCPHRCVFCDQQKIAGAVGVFPSAGEIRDTVAAYRKTSGCRVVDVAFYGGSFTGLVREDQQRLLLPLQDLIAAGEVSSVRVSTRPDTIDAATAGFLHAAGVDVVELGVQSMDDTVLRQAERGHTAADVGKAVSCLKSEGIAVGVQLMPGLPGDTMGISLASLSSVLELRPDFLRIYPTVVVAGTPLSQSFADGSYRPLSLVEAVDLCKRLLHRALLSGVPIVRMGLQPTVDLERVGTILAGPYHPAFRQMVEGELCYDLLERLAPLCTDGAEPITVSCSPPKIADFVGQKRSNVRRLFRDRGIRVGRVRGDSSLTPYEVVVEGSSGSRRGNVLQDLSY
jgi:histone acetyltransferase (RNA polymerase elongator complex component)